jgi:integrase
MALPMRFVSIGPMTGSLRQRGTNSWELRVYQGPDPTTQQQRYATRTIRGTRPEAENALAEMIAVANVAPAVGARTMVAELLERWFAISAPSWAPTTIRNTRSIIDMRPPSPAQVAQLLAQAAQSRPLFHLFLVLAATTGARRGELLALRWIDIDLDHGSRALLLAHRRQIDEPTDDMSVFTNDPAGARPWRANWVTKHFIATHNPTH